MRINTQANSRSVVMGKLAVRQRLCCLAVAACFGSADLLAQALPVGAQVVNGSAVITQVGKQMTVANSNGAIINWQQFNIGAGNAVRFEQTSASSSVLNRVLASDPSVILGNLTSNGKVWLVNPAGILVGQGARIDTAAFVASTMHVTNADFLANRLKFEAGPAGAGKVVNQGTITTPMGGSVYLIGGSVGNEGIITTPKGETILAAGNTVELIDSATPGVKVEIAGAAGNVTNLGEISAEAGRIGIAGVVVKNSGRINASSVVAEGGRIFLRATKKIELTESSRVGADGTAGGHITVIGTENGQIAGELVARGEISANGGGGFVETSAGHADLGGLKVAVGGGLWLIDPFDYSIDAAAAASIVGTLDGGGSVSIDTTTNAGPGAGAGGNGDITVASAIAKTAGGDATLTLNAHNNINLNASITSTVGQLNMVLNPDLDTSGGGAIVLATTTLDANGGTINAAGKAVSKTTGTATIDSAMSMGSLTLAGGTLSGSGSLTVSGAFDVTGLATVSGGGTLTTQGVTTISMATANGTLSLGGRSWSNEGTLNIGGDDRIVFTGGTNSLTNTASGTINLGTTHSLPLDQSAGTSTISNQGILNQTATGTHTIDNVATFNNSGTVNVDAGTLRIAAVAGTDTGTYAVDSGTTLEFNGSGIRDLNAGSNVSGAGSLAVSAGTVNINNLAGILTSGTGLSVSGGTLNVAVGAASGTLVPLSMTGGTLNLGSATTLSTLGLSSGTLSLNTGLSHTLASLTLAGGTLGGSDNLSISGAFDVTGLATVSGGGTLTTQGVTTISMATANGTLSLGGRSWINEGTLTIGGDDRIVFTTGTNSLTNTASGTINLGTTHSLPLDQSAGTSTISNQGILNQTATGTHTIDNVATFNNSGTVNVDAGILRIAAVAGTDTGTYAVDSGTTLEFSGSGTRDLNAGSNVSGAGTLAVSAGTVNLNGGAGHSVGGFSLSAGSIGGADALSVTAGGSFAWSGGTLGGTGTFTTPSGVTSALTGATKTLTRPWTHAGTATWTVGGCCVGLVINSTLDNSGTFDIQVNNSFTNITGTGTINNSGTFQKTTVGGTSEVAPSFNNLAGGIVNVSAGTLNFQGSGNDAAGSFYNLAAGITMIVSGAARSVESTFSGSGHLYLSGTAISFAGGVVPASLTTQVAAGTTNINTTGFTPKSITLSSGALNINQNISIPSLSHSSGTLAGSGNLTVTGSGVAKSSWTGGTLAGSGTLYVAAGAELELATGFKVLGDTRVIDNSGTINWTGGQLRFSQATNATRIDNQSGALLDIQADIPAPGFSDGAINNFAGATLRKSAGAGTASLEARFNNAGSVEIQSGRLELLLGNSSSGALTSHTGSFLLSAGTTLGMSYVGSNTFTAASSINQTGGAANFSATTSATVNGAFGLTGTLTTGGGTTTLSSTSTGISLANVVLSGGTLAGTSPLTVGNLTVGNATLNNAGTVNVTNLFTWNGGTLSGAGTVTIDPGATVNAAGASLSGATFVNQGTFNWNSGIFWFNNSTLNNAGTFHWLAADTVQHVGGSPLINNTGTFNFNPAASTYNEVPFNNMAGATLNVLANTLDQQGSFVQSGNLNVAGAATFAKAGGFSNAATTGIIGGAGTISVGAGNTVTNNGTVRPGGANTVGTLAITGHLSNSATGVIEIELLDNSTQYDKIAITGNATLGGTMMVNDLAGYQTVSGHTYSIFSSGGTISGTPTISSNTGGTYTGTGSPTFVLTATANGAAQFIWSGANSNFWDDVLNWTSSHVPTSTELAVIDGAGVKTVEVRSTGGAQSVRGVLFGSNGGSDNLLMSSGSSLGIDVTGMTVPASSTLTMNGGSLTAVGPVTVNGPLAWSSGTIGGGGVLSTHDTTTLTGGLLQGKTWNNYGTVNHSGANLNLNASAAVINNQAGANWNESVTGTVFGNGSSASFNNAGTLTLSAAGTADVHLTLNNSNQVSVDSGTLNLLGGGTDMGVYDVAGTLRYSGGTRNLNAGSNISGAGSLVLAGATVNLLGNLGIAGTGTVQLNGGTLNLDTPGSSVSFANGLGVAGATLSATDEVVIPVGQTLAWSSGTIGGGGVLSTHGTTTLTGGLLQGKTWNNYGTVNHSGANLNLNASAAVINNQAGANWNESVTGTVFGNSSSASFNNAGTLTLSAAGTADFHPAFSNQATGVIDVNGTSLFNQIGGFTQAGTINVASGASFQKTGGFTNAAGGVLKGGGLLNLGAGNTLTNNGTISPGVGAGNTATLNVTGNLTLGGTSIVEADIGGTTAGTQHDQISLSGNLILGGDIRYQATGGFTGGSGNSFALINPAGTTSGSANVSTLATNPDFSFALTTANGTLTIAGLMSYWTLANSGNWSTGSNWSRGVKPDNTVDVVIDHAGGAYTVTVNSAEAARSLKMTGDETLSIIGGSLNVVQASSLGVGATLNLSGGTLSGTGQVSLAGPANTWSGGALSGNLRVAPGATLTLNGATKNLRGGAAISNEGTILWSAGTINGDSGAASVSSSITNLSGALFDIQGDLTLTDSIDDCCSAFTHTLSFNNQAGAELRRSAGTGTLTLGGSSGDDSILFNLANAGSFNVNTGTVIFATGGFAANSNGGGLGISAGASLSTNGNALLNAASGVISGGGTLNLGAATLTNNGTISPGVGAGNTATLAVTGHLNLTGGTLDIDLGGTGAGQSDKVSVTGNVTMGGTLNATVAGGYTPVNADAIPFLTMGGTASGTFMPGVIAANFSTGYNLAGGEGARLIYSNVGTRTFNNSQANLDWGTALNWTGGLPGVGDTALISGSHAVSHAYGSDSIAALTIDSGNTVNVSGGSLTVSGLTSLGGGLIVSGVGAAALNGAVNGAASGQLNLFGGTLSIGAASTIATYQQSGGVLAGTGTLTISGAGSTWTGGTIALGGAGGLNLASGSTLALSGATNKLLDAGKLTNAGTMTISGAGNLILNNGAQLTNSNLLNIQGDADFQYTSGVAPSLVNTGTLRKSAGAASTVIGLTNPFTFTNSGILDAQSGTLQYIGNNSFTSGTSFTGAGVNQVSTGGSFSGAIGSGNLDLAGGSFSGTASFTGTTKWSGGSLAGAVYSIPAGSTLTIANPGNVDISSGTLNNAGTIAWSGAGNLLLNNGAQLNSSGLFSIQTDSDIQYTSGIVPSFNNSGTLQKTAGTGQTIIGLTNPMAINSSAATLDIQSGSLNLNGAVSFTGANTLNGNISIGGSGGGNNGSFLLGAGTVLDYIGGTHNFGGATSYSGAGTLTLSGATWTGTGTVNLDSSVLNWTGGTLSVGGAGGVTLAAGRTLALSGASNKALDAGKLINAGTMTVSGTGNLILNNGAQLTNSNLLDIQSDADFQYTSGAIPTFSNTGTLRKSAGAGVTMIGLTNPFTFSNSGILDAQSGTLQYISNNSFTAGSAFTGAGVNQVSSGGSFSGAVSSGNLELAGGSFSGTASFTGTTTWSGGSLVGAVYSIPAGSTLSIANPGNVDISSGALNNAGTIAWSGAGNLLLNNGAQLNSSGLFSIQTDGDIQYTSGAVPSFNNSGTVQKTASAGQTIIGLSNEMIIGNAGGMLDVQTGSLNLNGAVSFTGANTINGNVTISGSGGDNNGSLNLGAGTALDYVSGTHGFSSVTHFTGAGTLTLAGATWIDSGTVNLDTAGLNWTGGSVSVGAPGGVTVATGRTLALSGAGAKVLDGGKLTNAGTLTLSGGGNLILNNGAELTNNGLIDIQSDADFQYTSGAIPTFSNTGTLRKSAGAGVSVIGLTNPFTFTNSGILDAQSGTLQYISNNSFTAGSAFTGAGVNQVSTGGSFSGAISSGNLDLAGGNFSGTASFTGTTTWSGGSLAGAVYSIPAGSTLSIANPGNVAMSGSTLNNAGTLTLSGGGNLILNNGAELTNNGLIDIQSDADVQYTSGAVPTLSNSGTLRKSAGTGVTVIGLTNPITFSNAGVLDVQVGTVQLPGSFTNAGTLSGGGTLDVGVANTLFNTGTISPGVGAGNTATLSIVGNLNLAGGQLNVDLGGTGAGQFDKLAVSGNVTLGGALNATQVGGYTPVNGDYLPYLTMTGTAGGSFASTSLPANFDAGYNLAVNEASRLIYSTTGTKTFLNTASDLTWGNPANWSGGALPGAGNAALISAGFAVLHPSGNDTVAALTVNAANSLDISGGSLTVSGATSVGGSLSVSGGTLVLNGASSVQTLGMSAGALNGSGNLSIANGFNHSGGTVGLSGALDIAHTGDLNLPAMTALTSLLANATGHINLNGPIAASGSGNAVVLATGKDFNNAGGHTLTTGGGRWLVYSQSPATIAKGGLSSAFRRYGSSFGSYAPGSVVESGNGFIYTSAQPSLTADVSLPGATSHIYGDAPTVTYGISLTPSAPADNEDVAASFGVNLGAASFRTSVGNLAIDHQLDSGSYFVVADGLSSTLGYSIASGITPAYSVTPAPLTITANNQSKVYGDTLGFTGTEFIAGGLKNGQSVGSVILASGGAVPTANVSGGPYPISASAATGGSFNPTNYSINYLDGALAVTPRPLTASFAAQSKPYDGGTVASTTGYTLNNLANGETLNLGGTASFDDRHVGAGKTVSYTGLSLANGTGSAANYSIAATATGSGSITQLASVAWTGTAGDGKWSTAGNWAGSALPDGGNVAAVSLPPGATVSFDAATLATQLDSITVGAGGGFVMAGGSLSVDSNLTTPNYNQTGGTLNGSGSLDVSSSFAKSGGSLALTGLINITQAAGALTLINNAPLTLGAVSTSSGSILIDTSGGIFTTTSPVSANGGSLSLVAHSPIQVGSGGLSATGNISLTAATAAADSTIAMNGPITSSGGSVGVSAYGAVTQNASIQGQSITVASTSGNIAMAPTAVSTVPAGGSIGYSASAGSVTSSASNFAGATPTIASSSGSSGSGSSTNNDIVTAVNKTTDSLTDEVVSAPPPAPTSTDTASGPVQLAALTQTTGGDSGTFGAPTSEPTTPDPGLTSAPREPVDNSGPTPKPQAGETQESPKELAAEKDKGDTKGDEKDEKKKKKDEPKEEKKEERRTSAKKVAQCS